MSIELDVSNLELAFQGRPDIVGAIKQAAVAPNWAELFNEISKYVTDLRNSLADAEPVSKKRRIEVDVPSHPASKATAAPPEAKTNGSNDQDEASVLQVKEVSFVMPQRKKYTVSFTKSYIEALHPDASTTIPGSRCSWDDIAYAFCLPVPEKSQKQYHYALFPKNSHIVTSREGPATDPLVFTVPVIAPKPGTLSGPDAATASSVADSSKSLFDYFLTRHLKAAGNGVTVVEPNEKQFASALKEAYRPGEKAVYVKSFRGSKDGYLFFLSTGILWGFKKPLLFLPKEQIAAVSYTNVLQRTFNLNVEVYIPSSEVAKGAEEVEEDKEEFEFAMIDQEDFENINTYVSRNGLQDTSMAEQRRAKRLGVNAVKTEDGTVVDVDDANELQKAEQALQDEEDEEEEDYDPGSDGDSDGSGTSSEEDDDDEGQDGGEEDDEDDEDGEGEEGGEDDD